MKKIFALFVLGLLTVPMVMADEGMWIPMLLGRNEAAMQKAGMRITVRHQPCLPERCRDSL